MYYAIENARTKKIGVDEISLKDKHRYFGFVGMDDREAVFQKLGLSYGAVHEMAENKSLAYENHEGFDLISLSILNHKSLFAHGNRVYIYLHKNILLFICADTASVTAMMHGIAQTDADVEFDRILGIFFERLTADDVSFLDRIEQETSDLENALITSKKRNCVKEIISLRKRLMVFKRYYEQLLNVLDELQENENNIVSGTALHHFKIYAAKVERLYHSVLNLRDYVTQVREAYQAEVDISLNNIMKLFTVITAIFLPLTLIVGWYGMNLQMPEFQWPLGYPMVILLSMCVVVFCLVYFKKNKWF